MLQNTKIQVCFTAKLLENSNKSKKCANTTKWTDIQII